MAPFLFNPPNADKNARCFLDHYAGQRMIEGTLLSIGIGSGPLIGVTPRCMSAGRKTASRLRIHFAATKSAPCASYSGNFPIAASCSLPSAAGHSLRMPSTA
jgi:hypothetical protein